MSPELSPISVLYQMTSKKARQIDKEFSLCSTAPNSEEIISILNQRGFTPKEITEISFDLKILSVLNLIEQRQKIAELDIEKQFLQSLIKPEGH